MIPSIFYLERFRNEETRTYSKHSAYSEATEAYRPNADHDGFALKTFAIPKEKLNIYVANPPADLREIYLNASHDTALFCVHPQILDMDETDSPGLKALLENHIAEEINVVPSSSTRTLFTTGNPFHALKVHFPFRVSRYGRKMRDEVIEQAIRVSLDIETNIDCFTADFAYLREVIGVSLKDDEEKQQTGRGENWGYLVRDMRPFPAAPEQRKLIPGFALYGLDFFDSTIEPLIYQLIGDQDPLTFVLEKIMLPIISHWLQCYSALGYILEPHGQNVLLELDGNGNIARIVHRDLSTGIDMRRRRDLGLNSDHLNNYNRMDHGEFNSIAYDMFTGNHFFDNIVTCCINRYPHLTEEDFRAPCREHFVKNFPAHTDYFPPTIRYFSEELDRYGKPGYCDTGKKPLWRP
jgi:hypothetical protein